MSAQEDKRARASDNGFTLIELLVVIIIIAILAAIAFQVFLDQRKKGYDAQVKSDLRNAATAEETYLAGNPTSYTTTQSALIAVDWKTTTGNTFVFAIDTSNAFCVVGHSPNSSNYFVYDSGAGGLDGTAYADQATAQSQCTSITSPTWL